jgi:hypothetical protein
VYNVKHNIGKNKIMIFFRVCSVIFFRLKLGSFIVFRDIAVIPSQNSVVVTGWRVAKHGQSILVCIMYKENFTLPSFIID